MSEEPDRDIRSGYESVPPGSGRAIAGVLLLLAGLCMLLLGGACTMIWIGELAHSSFTGDWIGPALLLVSVVVAILGILGIVFGLRMLRGPRPGAGKDAGGGKP